VLSGVLRDELVEKVKSRFGLEADALPILTLYGRHAKWVEAPALEKTTSRDPDDDRVLATAVAGEADAIVTGDGDLL
jgi:putative PIN family toxin of toxin-antitoxin system